MNLTNAARLGIMILAITTLGCAYDRMKITAGVDYHVKSAQQPSDTISFSVKVEPK